MKLLNFKEFKENSSSEVTLRDYLDYLDSKKKEIDEAVLTAKELGLYDSLGSELNDNLAFLNKLLEIIDGNKKDIIIHTIDKLSLEDLQALYEDKIGDYTKDLEELDSKMAYFDSKIAEEEKVYNQKMRENGYSKDYYEAPDTDMFFSNSISAFEYVKQLIEQDEIAETELRQALSKAIVFEAKRANKKMNEAVLNCMVDGILTLFVKCQKLNKMLSDKSEYIVNSLISKSGISKILMEFFKEDIIEKIFLDMQNTVRENTQFFKNLPDIVQKSLIDERFEGTCFNGLYNFYNSLTDSNISMKPFSLELDRLKEEKSKVLKEISLVENNIELEKQFIQDEEKLREFLKSNLEVDKVNALTFDQLDRFVNYAQGDKSKEVAKISSLEKEIEENNSRIARLEEIMNTVPLYSKDADIRKLDAENAAKIMEAYSDIEDARFEQIRIMIEAQKELIDLERKIKELKSDKVKSVVSKSHRQAISRHTRQYDAIVLDTYSKLNDQGILLVETPKISIDEENNLVASPSRNKSPKNFDDLTYIAHSFWNLEDCLDEILEYSLATEEDVTKLVTIQKHCVNKLFSFSKDEDNFYKFTIEDSERDILLQCQESIVYLAKALYQKRCAIAYGDNSEANNLISDSLANELQSLGLTSYNKEDLQGKVFSLIKINESLNSEKSSLEEEIKDAMIEGIDNVDDAIKYRDMLIGINDYCVPPEEIIDVLQMRK